MVFFRTGEAGLLDSSPLSRLLARTHGRAGISWIAHLAFAILIALLVCGGAYHEPWFDEAQSWLIARDSTPWAIVSHLMHYEGTPGLWPLLLWGLQRVGYPYRAFWLISSTLAAAGSWLILYRSPFPLWVRIGLIFSYFQAYQFAVVARSYALDALLFPLIALAWPSRVERRLSYALLLSVLANTNAYAFLLSAPLAVELVWSLRSLLWRKDARAWSAALLYAAFAIAAVLQASPAADLNFSGVTQPPRSIGALLLFTQAFIDRGDVFATTLPTSSSLLGGVFLTTLVVAPVGFLCSKAHIGALLWIGILLVITFFILKYGKLWHSGVIFLYFITMAWVAWPARERLSRLDRYWLDGALALLLIYNLISTAVAFTTDIRLPYSSSSAAVAVVKRLRVDNPGAKVAVLGFTAFNVQPSFPTNVFVNNNGGAPRPAYIDWSVHQTVNPWPKLADLQVLLARTRPDMVLMSATKNDPVFVSAARTQGYCVAQELPGYLVWKSYVGDRDPLIVLRPCRALAASSHAP